MIWMERRLRVVLVERGEGLLLLMIQLDWQVVVLDVIVVVVDLHGGCDTGQSVEASHAVV